MCKEVYANNNPQKSAIQEAISTALYSLTTYHPVLKWNNLDNVLHKGKSIWVHFIAFRGIKPILCQPQICQFHFQVKSLFWI